MITFARTIEAWRDARIFDFPTQPRGRAWHLLKYPQYTFWMISFFSYAELTNIGIALLIVAADTAVAYFAFEFFLKYFRR